MHSVIIRGPLGVGKTTVAKLVAEKINGRYISVDQLLERNGLDHASDGEGIPLENFLKANECIVQEARQASTQGKPVVIDGNFYHEEQIERLVEALGKKTIVFTLKAPIEICLIRNATREEPYGEDATRVVHMFVSRFDYGTIIETEHQTIDQTMQVVLDRLESR